MPGKINSAGDEVFYLRGLAFVALIVKLRTKTMSHDNGNFSSHEIAAVRCES